MLLSALGIAVWIYCTWFRVQNVFDQMYYSRVPSNSVCSLLKNPRALFEDVPQLKTPARDADKGSIWMGNSVYEHYDSRFLEEGHKISLSFHMTDRVLYIDYFIRTDGEEAWYEYIYRVDEKTLTYKTSDPENGEMKNFLAQRVLYDWFAANETKTRFSLQDWGRYTFLDAS